MNAQLAQLRYRLQAHASLPAAALQLALKISQPTLSRALRSLGDDLLKIGRGPRTRYGLRRNVRGLGSRWPIYRIDSQGACEQLGTLQALHQSAFRFEPAVPCTWLVGEFRDGVFPDLPWFLADLRPQGFLGRMAARRMAPVLLCDPDPRNWSADLILHSLLAFGAG